MATLSTVNLDMNQVLVTDYAEESAAQLVPTPYFEAYLFNILADLVAINDELAAGSVSDGANVGAGAEVFKTKNGSILDFRTLVSADSSVTITQGIDEIDLAAAAVVGSVANSILTYNIGAGEYTEFAEFLISFSGGVTTMQFEDSGGAKVTGLTVDGDGQLGLFFDDVQVGNTRAAAAGGLFVNNTLTGAGFERALTVGDLLTFGNDVVLYTDNTGALQELALGAATEVFTSNGPAVAPSFEPGGGGSLPTPTVEGSILTGDLVGGDFDELPQVTIEWLAGVVTVSVEDDGAVLQPVFVADADGQFGLFNDGVEVANSNTAGIQLPGPTGVNAQLVLQEVGVDKGLFFWSRTANTLAIRGAEAAAHILIEGNATATGNEVLADFNPDVGTEFYSVGGVLAADVHASGLAVHGTGFPQVQFKNGVTSFGFLFFDISASIFTWRSDTDSSHMQMVGQTSGGADVVMVDADPDTGVAFNAGTPSAPPAYTRDATIVEDRTLLASASATTLNNNNVLAALIADLTTIGLLS